MQLSMNMAIAPQTVQAAQAAHPEDVLWLEAAVDSRRHWEDDEIRRPT